MCQDKGVFRPRPRDTCLATLAIREDSGVDADVGGACLGVLVLMEKVVAN